MTNITKNGSVTKVEAKEFDLDKLKEGLELPKIANTKLLNDYLNRAPKPEWVKVNKFSDNAKYLPIRVVENLLRSFFGMYQTEMIGQPHIIGNSVVVSVHLKVYHPFIKEWLTFAGVGAVPIELEKGASPLQFEQIKSKALHKNIPAAKSFAVSNAAKSIGRIFGSDLNNDELSQIYNVYGI